MRDLMGQTLEGTDAMKARETNETFGKRLAEARQRRGLTQPELGKAVGASQRVIAYYEGEGGQPPGALLAPLARTLKVTSDELLGLKPATEKPSPKTARLLKRLRKIEELPAADRRTVLKLLDALHESRQRTTPPPRQNPRRQLEHTEKKKPGRKDRAVCISFRWANVNERLPTRLRPPLPEASALWPRSAPPPP